MASTAAVKRFRAEDAAEEQVSPTLAQLAGIEPKVRMEFVDAMSVPHNAESWAENLEKWKYQDDKDAFTTLDHIVGTWWRIGDFGGRPLWARAQEASLP